MIERIYNVPLRSGFRETAKHKKTKKAVSVLREFLSRHMHSDNILIGKNLNQELWKHGIKNPPHHVKVVVIKEDDGTVKAELHGFKYEHKKKDQKEKEKDTKETAVEAKKDLKAAKKDHKEETAETKETLDEADTSEAVTLDKKDKPKSAKKTTKPKKE